MTEAWKPTPGRDAMTRDGRRVTGLERYFISGGLERFSGMLGGVGSYYSWGEDGRHFGDMTSPFDLVRDADPLPAETDTPAIPSPVRQRTVTEIVPGPYGRLVVTGAKSGKVYLAISREASQGLFALDADELDALAATATELAKGLRADAMEAGE